MKIRFILTLVLAGLVAACSSTDYRSHKKVTQGIDYSRYPGNQAYYEFTSPFPPEGIPAGTETTVPSAEEAQLGEDEDFTSENLAGTYGNYGDVVVSVATRKFQLGASATRKDMNLFQKALDKAYAVALKKYRPVGFTYSMSSVGAVNSLSDITVNCKLSETSANEVGQSTCTLFFNTIKSTYLQLKEEAKQ